MLCQFSRRIALESSSEVMPYKDTKFWPLYEIQIQVLTHGPGFRSSQRMVDYSYNIYTIVVPVVIFCQDSHFFYFYEFM